MTEVHTQASNQQPIMLDVVVYWRTSGIALAAVAALGIIMSLMSAGAFISGFLEFDWTHNIVHVVLAALALTLGFTTAGASVSRLMAKIVGIVYLLLGILGFIPPVVTLLSDMLGLHLELGENLVHLLIGAWGVVAGFAAE